MGIGDEIMVTGQARQLQELDSHKVGVIGKDGKPRWHFIWQNNPRIARPGVDHIYQPLVNHSGRRPYVERYNKEKWWYTNWKVIPGEIYLSKSELTFGVRYSGKIIIEPNIKAYASQNKSWGFDNFQRLVHLSPDLPWAQFSYGQKLLQGVGVIETRDFRHACAVMNFARAYVGPDGGLHHAAAAFGVPGVVIFGGMISPLNTGYECHINMVGKCERGLHPCGMRIDNLCCRKAMNSITPEDITCQLDLVLSQRPAVKHRLSQER